MLIILWDAGQRHGQPRGQPGTSAGRSRSRRQPSGPARINPSPSNAVPGTGARRLELKRCYRVEMPKSIHEWRPQLTPAEAVAFQKTFYLGAGVRMVWPEPSNRVELVRDHHGLEERDIAGLSGDDAERRLDTVIADSKKAISRTGASLATCDFGFLRHYSAAAVGIGMACHYRTGWGKMLTAFTRKNRNSARTNPPIGG